MGRKSNKKMTIFLFIIFILLFSSLFIRKLYGDHEINKFNDSLQQAETTTNMLSEQITKSMKNSSISLPYPNITVEEVEKNEQDLIALRKKTDNIAIPNNKESVYLENLKSRQKNIKTTLEKQKNILVIYQLLTEYYESDFLNERGEFKFSPVKDMEIEKENLLRIKQNIRTISNTTLNRSFSEALSHIEEQVEVRQMISLSIQRFIDLDSAQNNEEYMKLKEDIYMIDNIKLQNKMLQYLNQF